LGDPWDLPRREELPGLKIDEDALAAAPGVSLKTAWAIALAVLGVAVGGIWVPHVSGYFFLFDDFAVLGDVGQLPVARILGSPAFDRYLPLTYLLEKAEFQLFGWSHPGAYAFVSTALHLANTALVYLLGRHVCRSAQGALIAGGAFLLSPWSSEAFFWVTGQCDLVSTLGVLAALLCGLRAIEAGRGPGGIWFLSGTILFALVALFTKEIAVTLPALLAAAALLSFAAPGRAIWARVVGLTGLLFLIVVIYLAVREAMIPGLGSPYGTWPNLMSGANLGENVLRYMQSVIGFPTPFDAAVRRLPFQLPGLLPLGVGIGLLLLSTHWGDGFRFVRPVTTWRLVLIAMAAYLISTLPVLWWTPLPHRSTAGGRFLYLPGVWVSMLLGLRYEAACQVPAAGAGRAGRRAAFCAMVLLCGYSLASLRFHADIWKASARLSRSVIGQFEPLVGSVTPVYIEDLPVWFIEGPYVLKDYAFSYYYQGRPVPPVRAAHLTLRYGDSREIFVRRRETPGGEAREDERRLQLVLDLRK
jgi:hypothetical protein